MSWAKFLGLLLLLLVAISSPPASAQSGAAVAAEGPLDDFEVPTFAVDSADDALSGPITASLTTWRLEEPFVSPATSPSIRSGAPEAATESTSKSPTELALVAAKPRTGFQWVPAIRQSFRMLAFQQGMMLATDKWSRYTVSRGKFFADYANAVRGGLREWDDADPFIDNYIGHPLMGAVSGFIQVQNDPQGRALHLGKQKAYWQSRLKAMGWAALYSTQFEIGPLSESSIQNMGGAIYQNCDTCKLTRGAGWVDIVVTPTLGTAWLIGEDALDQYLVRRLERKLGPGKWSNFFRSVLNPARVAANAVRFKPPWHRDNREREVRRPE